MDVVKTSVISPSVTEAEFEVLAKRAGLTLDAAQHNSLYAVYGHLEGMLARVRGPSDRARGAEPAHVFVPRQEWPAQSWPERGSLERRG